MDNTEISSETLNNEERITLGLLNVVEEDSRVTQRSLAGELGVALGIANSYLKRCVKKGFIKIRHAPSNRYAYYVTPKGFTEKSRLTTEYLKQSFNFFRLSRAQTEALLENCINNGWRRVALAGKSELAEITILSATERDVEIVGIIDAEAAETTALFMNLPVVDKLSDLGPLHALIITDMATPQATFDEAVKYVPRDTVLTPQILNIRRGRNVNGSSRSVAE